MTGAIKYLGDGFGFIAGDDGADRFFLASALDSFGPKFAELRLQQRVQFTAIAGPDSGPHKGKPRAVDVRAFRALI